MRLIESNIKLAAETVSPEIFPFSERESLSKLNSVAMDDSNADKGKARHRRRVTRHAYRN